jgi:ADP-ribose pyrophosphatase YjhB (NUDIX family)
MKQDLKLLVRKIWKKIPSRLRLGLVRVWQDRFTVSAAGLILNDEGKILLLNHVLRPFSGWGLPGGFVDHGESAEAAIRRELMEETGFELIELKMYRTRVLNKHVEILFTARSVGEPEVLSREIIELGWFSLDDLPEGMSAPQVKVIMDVLRDGT